MPQIASSISVIVIPLIVSALVERVLNAIIKPLHSALFPPKESSNPIRSILDVVDGVVPFVLNVLRNIFYFLDFPSTCTNQSAAGCLEIQ
jgi:hypothetical protein